MVHPDQESNRQTDGAPERVAPSDPVPEGEHVVRIDPELFDFLGRSRHGDEVLWDSGLAPELLDEPSSRAPCVHQRFLRRACLALYDEERLLRGRVLEGIRKVRTVDVRHEVPEDAWLPVWLVRQTRHRRPQIAA